jgi:hypothetical protein
MVAMLNALEREADHIRSEMTSHYISNTTATAAALYSRIEQETVYKTHREGTSEAALVARSGKPFKKSPKVCSNLNCAKSGHTIDKVGDIRFPLRPRDHFHHTSYPIHCHGHNFNENILTPQNDSFEAFP